MAGLDKLILPGDAITAADVATNFTSLRTVVNSLKDDNFEPGTLDTRHFVPQSLSSDGLDFKAVYRREFNETSINSSTYTEVVKLSSGKTFPRLYREDSVVFVFAEIETYHTGASSVPLGAADLSAYGFRLEFGQAAGAVTTYSSAAFVNATERYITPGSNVSGVPAEVGNVVLFGAARVISSSSHFDARVMARAFAYGLGGSGGSDGRCKGAISALVISR